MRSTMRAHRLLIGLGLLGLAGFLGWVLWRAVTMDGGMSVHGWIAMALGLGLTAALAVVLMGLAFYSSRRGWDDIDRDP